MDYFKYKTDSIILIVLL